MDSGMDASTTGAPGPQSDKHSNHPSKPTLGRSKSRTKHWQIFPHDAARIRQLERAASVPSVVAQLLLCRSIENPTEAQQFLAAKLSDLRDPGLLPGTEVAADLIYEAVKSNRAITIYGDYDCDGMTSTAILYRCLKLMEADVTFYVPDRLNEGYGVNCGALEKLAREGRELVVTVDCGINSCEQAKTAKRLGLDLIITDHHTPGDALPDCAAVVHPAIRPGYPFHGLCGAGIAFKLAWAVCQRMSDAKKVQPRFRNFLISAIGLAAIGTVADVVPLLDENRLIVRHGLKSIKSQPSLGLAALTEITGVSNRPTIRSEDIAFSLAPRLNAAGRLGQAKLAIELLITDDSQRAKDLAAYINELNVERDGIERSIYLAAQNQVKEQFDADNDAALVLAGRGWHPGVIGIVAGRLAEKYCRPVIMIAMDKLGEKVATGSARSAFGLNLYDALSACSSDLHTFGGHAAAAGLRIDEAHIATFRNHFREHVGKTVAPEQRTAVLRIDGETTLPQLTLRTVDQIECLAPFGQRNPRPILCTTGVTLEGPPKKMGGGDRHLALRVKQGNRTFRAVAFGFGEDSESLSAQSKIDIAYRPVINEFRGMRSVEVQLVDWRPAR